MPDQSSSSASPSATQTTAAPAKPANSKARGPLFLIFGGVVVLAGLGFGAYTLMEGGKSVETDNAYVDASTASITPLVAASVKEANIYETKPVKAGDVLVVLDDTDAKLALAAAQAQLDQATRQIGTYYENDATLKAQADASAAQVNNAQATYANAVKAYNDRKALADSGAVSGEDVQNAKTAMDQAQAALATAKAQAAAAVGQRASNTAIISGVGVTENPQVVAARVKVEQAQLDLDRTVILAPIDGIVSRNTVEVGQRVQVGQALMSIVPIQSAYVNANFKEVQLKKVQIGQPVELTADVYGGSVKYHGKVSGLSGGTGSSMAIIPAQNATGNWIKVVQRVPVRISLNPTELKQHPLRVGMSMKAKISINE